MKQKLQKELERLSKFDLCLVLGYVRLRLLRQKIGALRPVQLLVPATLAQIAVFIFAAFDPSHFLTMIAVGNFTIVGLAIFPSTLRSSPLLPGEGRVREHWVK